MNKDKVIQAMNVINDVQQKIWSLSHQIREVDPTSGNFLWENSLQIEYALMVLNEEILGGNSYYENLEAPQG